MYDLPEEEEPSLKSEGLNLKVDVKLFLGMVRLCHVKMKTIFFYY